MTTPYTIRQDGKTWIAHSLAFDLVACASEKDESVRRLGVMLKAQIQFGIERGLTLRDCYFGAPPEYWTPPFYEIPIPSDELESGQTGQGA